MVSMHIAGKRLVNICIEYCVNITILHFFKGAPAHFFVVVLLLFLFEEVKKLRRGEILTCCIGLV